MNELSPFEYYNVLGVTPSATTPDIRQAYKKLALKYHPDKHKQRLDNDTNMDSINNQFVLINEAYSVLSHQESRARYDSMCYGEKTLDQELPDEQLLIIGLFREIMAKKEQIIELSESFISFAISMCWVTSEDKLLSAFEKEISIIESNILEENKDAGQQASSDTSLSDSELSTHYLHEDDIIQVVENSQWILIDKETLVLSEFAESHRLFINSVTAIVSPLMMACSYGTWDDEKKTDLLQRVTALMTQIMQYLESVIQKTKPDGEEFKINIIDKMETQDIKTQIDDLRKHPIFSKISNGKFGQNNNYPLIKLAAFLGPPFAGQPLYWSILAVILLNMITIRLNEGDFESFQQFLNILEEIAPIMNNITK